MADGVELIAAERARQIEVEGWSAEHDAEHPAGQLTSAAIAYSMHVEESLTQRPGRLPIHLRPWHRWWPWQTADWKPDPDPVRNLVKAGALIAAEIDRLNRADRKEQG